ncbi:hypothetical protein V8F20_006951 [Naviculisporaceae sp. PSN 640]
MTTLEGALEEVDLCMNTYGHLTAIIPVLHPSLLIPYLVYNALSTRDYTTPGLVDVIFGIEFLFDLLDNQIRQYTHVTGREGGLIRPRFCVDGTNSGLDFFDDHIQIVNLLIVYQTSSRFSWPVVFRRW